MVIGRYLISGFSPKLNDYQTTIFTYLQRSSHLRKITSECFNIINNQKIDLLIFYDYPHHADSFVLYHLAKFLNIKVKIIFSVVLLAITAITFETLVVGFERQFNNSSKSVVIPQGKLDLVLEEIQFNEELIENIEKEFADVESEEQQNLEKMIKENNAAIEVYRKNIRDREKLI